MDDEVELHSGAVHRRDAARAVRLLIALAFAVVIVLLALDNRDDTRVGYLWDHATFPLWAVIVGSAVGGVIVGWLLRHRPRRNVG